MCGIAGILSHSKSIKIFENEINNACKSMHHRGPDANGLWTDYSHGIVLGHTRLAVVELSDAGKQPMISDCGRYVLVFNGEIYNHFQIRKKINALCGNNIWKGRSDTETIFRCFQIWGVKKTLNEVIGMFAFAFWDNRKMVITLGRDRFGEKPLFYGISNGCFAFASELKAFRHLSHFNRDIDEESLSLFLQLGHVPGTRSIYKQIYKLSPGSIINLTKKSIQSAEKPIEIKYWDSISVAIKNSQNQINIHDDKCAIEMLEQRLSESVSMQMEADVPLGAFLSGGIDSAAVVAMMQANSTRPVNTFSIGFEEPEFDEAPFAKKIAKHLGTSHFDWYISVKKAMDVIPNLSKTYCEPFADVSQIATILVSKMASSSVTVALSGDGGDEMFGGYNRHTTLPKIWEIGSRIPLKLRKSLVKIINLLPSKSFEGMDLAFSSVIRKQPIREIDGKIRKVLAILASENRREVYSRIISSWEQSNNQLVQNITNEKINNKIEENFHSFSEFIMLLDTINYLPDDILTKVDRAAMSVSLETRIPFLDHRIYEFAWKLPLELKVRQGVGKWILRQMLYKHVPQNLFNRPKAGFAVPVGKWLRSDLRDWAEELLTDSYTNSPVNMDKKLIKKMWIEHLSEKRNWENQLWRILMFHAWYKEQNDNL